jgi:hypothetical protein
MGKAGFPPEHDGIGAKDPFVSRPFATRSKNLKGCVRTQLSDSSVEGNGREMLAPKSQGATKSFERGLTAISGRPKRLYRVVDILAAMERRGSVTSGMRRAGEDFRAHFKAAQLHPLSTRDMSWPMTGRNSRLTFREERASRIENAREVVWRAILAVGGLGSAAGSCLWHVLGWERSLKEWAGEQGWSGRRVSQETASGIFIAALGMLEAHFANDIYIRN